MPTVQLDTTSRESLAAAIQRRDPIPRLLPPRVLYDLLRGLSVPMPQIELDALLEMIGRAEVKSCQSAAAIWEARRTILCGPIVSMFKQSADRLLRSPPISPSFRGG